MRYLFSLFIIILFTACEKDTGTDAGKDTPNPYIGTWQYVGMDFGQEIITNSDQTTVPMMGHIMGMAPFDGGFIAEVDINETFNYMFLFGGFINKSMFNYFNSQ